MDAPEPPEPSPSPTRFFVLAFSFEAGLAVLAIGLGAVLGVNPWSTWRWSWPDLGWGVLATLPLLVSLWVLERYPFGPLVDLKRLMHQWILPLFHGLRIWQLAAIAAAAGVGEELLFRGLIQAGLQDFLGHWQTAAMAAWTALAATSLAFALAHLVSKTYALLCFFMGLYLGGLWLATGNLLVPVGVHGLYDFLALVYLLRAPGRGGLL